MSTKLKFFCDTKRHLVCVPYSIENLHQMARELGIKRCWFHKDHYDVPKLHNARLIGGGLVEVVDTRTIVKIVREKRIESGNKAQKKNEPC